MQVETALKRMIAESAHSCSLLPLYACNVHKATCKRLFVERLKKSRDPNASDYANAMQLHYERGAPSNWPQSFVSQYATMHPWEDFAETVNAYLDIMAIATTANDLRQADMNLSPTADLSELIASILKIVVEANEYNFDLGLAPLLPEQVSPCAMKKLAYIHSLRKTM